ncbi:methyltransferase domain-containing protein [Magnetofaba australis]|nr:methyltransferase domain-containing protein [Magnetofaba australis]
MAKAVWEERYQAGRTGWDRGGASPVLSKWLRHASDSERRVLIPGCGRGHELAELARRGYEITALDFAPSAVAAAREALAEHPHCVVQEADLFHWEAREGTFDAIYEQTCLCALAPDQWREYEHRLFDWLRPEGRLYALFMQTHAEGGPPYHCAIEQMRRLFPSARWRWQQEPPLEVHHPMDKVELGLILTRC